MRSLPSFKLKFSICFITSCYVIFSLSMVTKPIWTDFDAFLRRNGTRARGKILWKRLKTRMMSHLYFLLRVCFFSSAFVSTLQTRHDLIRTFDPDLIHLWLGIFTPSSHPFSPLTLCPRFWTFLPPRSDNMTVFGLLRMSRIPSKKKKTFEKCLCLSSLALHCYHPEVAWPPLDKNWPNPD